MPLSQKELNVPQAEAEHVIQPDGMPDDLGRKPVAVVPGQAAVSCCRSARPVPTFPTRLP